MDALADLRLQLLTANRAFAVHNLGDIRPMGEIARHAQATFGEGRPPQRQAILAAIKEFLTSGRLSDFRALKLVCFGMAARPTPQSHCVLEDAALTERLLGSVGQLHAQGKAKQFRRCCQGLLSVYFTETPFTAAGRRLLAGWNHMREFLLRWVKKLVGGERTPDWALALNEHSNLLSEAPCDRYGKAFLAGDRSLFETACARLSIPHNSWVRQQVLLAAVKSATALDDTGFTGRIDELLALLEDAPSFKRQGVVMLLERYADNDSHAPHVALQTVALRMLGNPLLNANTPRWDGVSALAKEMVGNWLKARVVEQFFELLSHDGATDKRRVKFWSSYVPVIDNIWLVLGAAARSSMNKDFNELRTLMGDHALALEGGSRTNNAFVMKIGQQYIVEFGEKGNAAYLYEEGRLPFRLVGALHVSADLKAGDQRYRHTDRTSLRWEHRFRVEMRLPAVAESTARPTRAAAASTTSTPAIPAARTTGTAATGGVFTPPEFEMKFRTFCLDHGLMYNDQRHRGLGLIVLASGLNSEIAETLWQWGFRYDSSRTYLVKR